MAKPQKAGYFFENLFTGEEKVSDANRPLLLTDTEKRKNI